MEFIVYAQIFSFVVCSTLLFFFPGIITYKNFSLVVTLISVPFLIKGLIVRKGNVTKSFYVISLIYSCICFMYYFITPYMYGEAMPDRAFASFLTLFGQIFPNALCASLIAEDENLQKKIKRLVPFIGTLFAIIALIITLNPQQSTSGGLAQNKETGLSYQTLAYMAAYSAAMMECFLFSRKGLYNSPFIQKFGGLWAGTIILVDLVTVLLAGGRGGFVAYIVFVIMTVYFFIRYKHFKFNINQVIKYVAIGFAFVIGLFVVIRYASNSSLETSGFSRITGFLNGSGDTGRDELRSEAINSFLRSPIIGHGFGSVYAEMSIYSHNFFSDALLECGVVGLAVILFVLAHTGFSALRLVRDDPTDLIWFYFFLCGFIMSMFSGYYLTQLPLWWAVAFIICKDYCKKYRIYNVA